MNQPINGWALLLALITFYVILKDRFVPAPAQPKSRIEKVVFLLVCVVVVWCYA